MRVGLLAALAIVLTVGGCGGKSDPGGTGKGGSGGAATRSCLDQPGAVPSPPRAGLPCELIPPGLELSTAR